MYNRSKGVHGLAAMGANQDEYISGYIQHCTPSHTYTYTYTQFMDWPIRMNTSADIFNPTLLSEQYSHIVHCAIPIPILILVLILIPCASIGQLRSIHQRIYSTHTAAIEWTFFACILSTCGHYTKTYYSINSQNSYILKWYSAAVCKRAEGFRPQ